MTTADSNVGGPTTSAPAGGGTRWTKVYAVLHHVLLALTIASVTVLAERLPYFVPVDIITRGGMSLVQAWLDQGSREATIKKGFRVEWDPVAAGDRPRVILVRRFAEQAADVGLHPTELAAELIQAVARKRPAVLAIDLDLDPVLDELRLNDPECDYLLAATRGAPATGPSLARCDASRDHLLPRWRTLRAALEGRLSLVRALEEAAERTMIVVSAPPFPLDVRAIGAEKEDPVWRQMLYRQLVWTQEVCRLPNVRVALGGPDLSTGLAFRRNTPMLGNLAWHAARTPKPRDDIRTLQLTSEVPDGCTPFRPPTGVQRVTSFQDAFDLVQMMESVGRARTFATIGTMSSRYYETMSHGIAVHVSRRRPGRPVSDIIPDDGLEGKVVFLGDDQYVTRVLHFDQRPLVDFHAAVYYSNLHDARSLRHVFAFLLDVGLGTVLGILFGRLWAWYSEARMAMDRTVATSLQGMVTKAPSYLHARGVLLMNLILQMALTAGMFVVAYVLLRFDVWINPLPLVLGMSIKGLLASRQPHVGQEPGDWWAFFNRHPDVVPLQAGIIVISLGLAWYLGH